METDTLGSEVTCEPWMRGGSQGCVCQVGRVHGDTSAQVVRLPTSRLLLDWFIWLPAVHHQSYVLVSAASSLLETPSCSLFKTGSVLPDSLALWELDRRMGSNADGCLSS